MFSIENILNRKYSHIAMRQRPLNMHIHNIYIYIYDITHSLFIYMVNSLVRRLLCSKRLSEWSNTPDPIINNIYIIDVLFVESGSLFVETHLDLL